MGIEIGQIGIRRMNRLLIFDTETGGLDPAIHSLLSIGGVVWEDGRIVDTIEINIVEDQITADIKALAVNKIDLAEHKANGVDIYDAINLWEAFVTKHFGTKKVELCGHNVGFDLGFLKRFYRLSSREQFYDKRYSYRSLDTISLAFGLKLSGKLPLQKLNLASLWKHYGIEVSQDKAHNALTDALVTAEILNKMIGVINGASITT